jgi:uncharacterized membrane protein
MGGHPPRQAVEYGAQSAFEWAWGMYRSDLEGVALPVILSILGPLLLASLAHGVGRFITSTQVTSPDEMPSLWLLVVVTATGFVLNVLVCSYSLSALVPFLLNVARGRAVSLRDAFVPQVPYLRMLTACSLLGLPTAVGLLLGVIPGLFIGSLGLCFLPIVVDHDGPITELWRTCRRLGSGRVGPLCWFALTSVIVTLGGLLACGVGVVLIGMPLSALASTYMYLKLSGEQPVALDDQ